MSNYIDSIRAVNIIRELIVCGILGPKKVLEINIFCCRFNLNNRDVADAFATLEKEGLITFFPEGPEVRQISDEELTIWLNKRLSLEPSIVEKLASEIDDERLKHIELSLKKQSDAVHSGNLILFLDLSAQFHCDLAMLAGFAAAAHWLELIRDRLRINGMKALPDPTKLCACLTEHNDIVESLKAKKPKIARDAMIRHLSMTAERLNVKTL